MKKLLIAMAMLLAVTLASASAKADYILYSHGKDSAGEYHVAQLFNGKGELVAGFMYDKDWKLIKEWYKSKGNPNPESDNQGGAIEPPSVATLKKLADAANRPFEELPQLWKTPLGQQMIEQGKGPVPAINPNPEDDDRGGESGPKGASGPDPNDFDPFNLNKEKEQKLTGPGATFEFQPNAGSAGEQLQGMAGKKGSSGDGAKPDKKDAIATGHYFGDLPGPPELVNPNPVARSRAHSKQPSAAATQMPSAGAGAKSAPSAVGIAGPRR